MDSYLVCTLCRYAIESSTHFNCNFSHRKHASTLHFLMYNKRHFYFYLFLSWDLYVTRRHVHRLRVCYSSDTPARKTAPSSQHPVHFCSQRRFIFLFEEGKFAGSVDSTLVASLAQSKCVFKQSARCLITHLHVRITNTWTSPRFSSIPSLMVSPRQ